METVPTQRHPRLPGHRRQLAPYDRTGTRPKYPFTLTAVGCTQPLMAPVPRKAEKPDTNQSASPFARPAVTRPLRILPSFM